MTVAIYRIEMKQFSGQWGDEKLARHFNTLFFRGHGISNAEQTFAGLTHFDARFLRIGTEALPKAVRSPRGWRRLALPRSRQAWALGVWVVMAWRVVERGHPRMAPFLVLRLCS